MIIQISIVLLFFSPGSSVPTQSQPSSMSLTLDDFLKINKANNEAYDLERARDRQERAEERASDLDAISKLIESGVKEEVTRVIQPIQEKNETRLGCLESQMNEIKNLLRSGLSADPPLSSNPTTNSSSEGSPGVVTAESEVIVAISNARRIISLQPIHKEKDVGRQFRMHDHVTNDQEAMLSAVLEYLKCEMRFNLEELPKIVKIFPPANTPVYDRLYIEFESEHSAEYVSSFARLLRKSDRQVSIYVPGYFQARFRAFNNKALLIRTAPGLSRGDVKTKVKYGLDDFKLMMKPRNGYWKETSIDLSNFPPMQPPGTAGPTSTLSPPPRRPRDSPTTGKRSAPSPLERPNKAPKSTTGDVPTNPAFAEQPQSPATPPYSPSLAAHSGCAKSDHTCSPCTPSYSPSLAANPRSVQPGVDHGRFAQTAISSPKHTSNKHFTFSDLPGQSSKIPLKSLNY